MTLTCSASLQASCSSCRLVMNTRNTAALLSTVYMIIIIIACNYKYSEIHNWSIYGLGADYITVQYKESV